VGNYNPEIRELRKILAFNILDTLETAGFEEVANDRKSWGFQTKERVFARNISDDGRVKIKVFTTIVANEVRNSGKDSIRVCATWDPHDGRSRGLVKITRVHRTGDIEKICQRMLERMREVWKRVNATERCSCGTPKFKSKKGNMVCADLCWKRRQREQRQRKTNEYARQGNVGHWAMVEV